MDRSHALVGASIVPVRRAQSLDLACTVLDMTPQELREAAQAYAKAVEARPDLTLSTKNTYLVHVRRFVEWYSQGRSWLGPFDLSAQGGLPPS